MRSSRPGKLLHLLVRESQDGINAGFRTHAADRHASIMPAAASLVSHVERRHERRGPPAIPVRLAALDAHLLRLLIHLAPSLTRRISVRQSKSTFRPSKSRFAWHLSTERDPSAIGRTSLTQVETGRHAPNEASTSTTPAIRAAIVGPCAMTSKQGSHVRRVSGCSSVSAGSGVVARPAPLQGLPTNGRPRSRVGPDGPPLTSAPHA